MHSFALHLHISLEASGFSAAFVRLCMPAMHGTQRPQGGNAFNVQGIYPGVDFEFCFYYWVDMTSCTGWIELGRVGPDAEIVQA